MWNSIINYIWANYNNSLTWNKAILGWFLLLSMIPVRSQWGRYNLPRLYAYYHLLISWIIKKHLLLLIVSIMLPRFVFGELEQFPSFKLVETCFPFFCQLKPAKNVPHSGLPETTVDGRNPAPPWMIETYEHRVKPSINWCRISQPSTVGFLPPAGRASHLMTPGWGWALVPFPKHVQNCAKPGVSRN